VVYNYCWSSPAQSLSCPSPAGLIVMSLTLSDLRLPKPEGPGPCIYIPQEQGVPVISQALGYIFIVTYYSQGYGVDIRIRLHRLVSYGLCADQR
jgi:hypothetical protein